MKRKNGVDTAGLLEHIRQRLAEKGGGGDNVAVKSQNIILLGLAVFVAIYYLMIFFRRCRNRPSLPPFSNILINTNSLCNRNLESIFRNVQSTVDNIFPSLFKVSQEL